MSNFFKSSLVLLVLLQFSQSASAQLLKPMDGAVLGGLVNRGVFHSLFPLSEKDEAMMAMDAGKMSAADYQKLVAGSSEDYFREMDNGITLPQNQEKLVEALSPLMPNITKQEATLRMARGRNNWIVWTGGNDRFWNYLGRAAQGGLDFLKTISTHPELPAGRHNRWQNLGLVNEPCYREATGPNPDRWGLWIDSRVNSTECGADPFSDAVKYPGIKIGSRGTVLKYKGQNKNFEVGSFYGYPTGIVGFRLFTNPDFDQKAADRWDPVRFYTDPAYYNDPNTIRPYRVGMACALCHVGPNPTHPPADFNNPKWADLSSNPGAQYFWVDRIFAWDWKKGQDNFVYQLLHTARPGTLDTSLISSDQINNPRTMNAVYDLPARLTAAVKFSANEQLRGDETLNQQFSKLGTNVVPQNSVLRTTAKTDGTQVLSPRVLKDGSDSVGALGALNRVYVNIGLFGEEWVKHFIPLIGGPQITAFPIKTAEKNSLYWRANVQQTPDLALFFLAAGRPDKLADAPEGTKYLQDFESQKVTTGKKVFAENCARCHSSKLPDKAYTFFKSPACQGAGYMSCWNAYWNYSKTAEFKTEMAKMVMEKDFLDHNFLSNDQRVPVTLTDSQLCSPIATNALKGDIWDNFSSSSYKSLPSVGSVTVNYPLDASSNMHFKSTVVPSGGRGFLRPPSLISLWSTAPFLQNNALGNFDARGTVQGRMSSFNDSITKLLNPEQRANPRDPGNNEVYGWRPVYYKTNGGDTLPGFIDVTTQNSYVKIPRGYLPDYLFNMIKAANWSNPVARKEFIKKEFDYLAIGEDPKPKRKVAEAEEPPPVPFKESKPSKNKKGKGRHAASIFGIDWPATNDPAKIANFIYLGPIPAGVPVNLISNLNLSASVGNLVRLNKAIFSLVKTTIEIRNKKLTGSAARDYFMQHAAPDMLDVSTCQDFVVNRGHYFGTKYGPDEKAAGSQGLSADDKAALIEYLKYM
jgi:hypothetical protein